jgi:hypothetical protein
MILPRHRSADQPLNVPREREVLRRRFPIETSDQRPGEGDANGPPTLRLHVLIQLLLLHFDGNCNIYNHLEVRGRSLIRLGNSGDLSVKCK